MWMHSTTIASDGKRINIHSYRVILLAGRRMSVCCCTSHRKLVMNGNLCRCLAQFPFNSAVRCAFNSHKISIVITRAFDVGRKFKPKSIRIFFCSVAFASMVPQRRSNRPFSSPIKYVDTHTVRASIIFTYAFAIPAYVTEPILTILLTIIGIDAIIVVCRKWCSYKPKHGTLHATYHTSLYQSECLQVYVRE